MKKLMLFSLAVLLNLTLAASASAKPLNIECSLDVVYNGDSIRISQKGASANVAMAKAFRTGCFKHCKTEDSTAECPKDCLKKGNMQSIQCFDENDNFIQPNQHQARRAAENNQIEVAQEATNRPHEQLNPPAPAKQQKLLLTTWVGQTNKAENSLLLDKETKRPKLLINAPRKKRSLLL